MPYQVGKTLIVHVNKYPFVQFTPNCVYLGRDYGGFHDEGWGNPFHIGKDGNRKEVLLKYRTWIIHQPQLLARLPELKDKVLGCWCDPLSCHGIVLAELANMRIGFEPGDGSFTIILQNGEVIPRQWNIEGITIMRETEPNRYQYVKQETEILAL